jgi:hypothetical protein
MASVSSAAAQAPPASQAPQATWESLPRMNLERQYAGPLKDTLIQRWRDPDGGIVCYLYLPISVTHTQPSTGGYVQYGANPIGSISCAQPTAPPSRQSHAPPAAPPARTASGKTNRTPPPAPPVSAGAASAPAEGAAPTALAPSGQR